MISKLRLALICFLISAASGLFAQNPTFSPYSRYGIGEVLYNGYGWQRAMGGVSIGSWNAMHLNFSNPAGNTADSVTLFELGLNGEAVKIENSQNSQDRINGSISYLTMGFPLKKGKWNLSLGIIPLSAVGYNIKQTPTDTLPGSAYFFYKGEGGFNRFFASTSFVLAKNLWFGVNASYIYGTVDRSAKVQFTESGYMNTRVTNSITLRDFYPEAGLMYNKQLKNGHIFTTGLTFSPKMDVNGRKDELWINYYLNSSGLERDRDTVTFVEDEKGAITFPMQVGVGFSFKEENHWLIGFDAKYQQWKDMTIWDDNASLNNTIRISTGAQWIPDIKSIRLFNKASYRIGGYYSAPRLSNSSSALGGIFQLGNVADNTAIELKKSDVEEAGISFGIGLPLRGKPYFSDLDLGFELSQRGSIENNLVRERYFRVLLGLTIREEWFVKPKFD